MAIMRYSERKSSKPSPSPPAPSSQHVLKLRIAAAVIEISLLLIWNILRQDVAFFSVSTFNIHLRTIVGVMWRMPRKRKINFRK
jgi:hypothetical protein